MKLRCVNISGISNGRLVMGKIYEQVSVDSFGDDRVIDETGKVGLFYHWHFDAVGNDACPQCGILH